MKRSIVIVLLVLLVSTVGWTQSVGGGLSFWLPESQYLAQEGSLGVESALGSSVSFGDLISTPFGVAFNQVYGLMPESAGTVGASPWFYADTGLAFLMLKARLPIGPLYIDAFGGVNGVWNMTLRPIVKNIEIDSAPAGHVYSFEGPLSMEGGSFGWGWQYGGGIGVTFGQISVDINITYREVRTDVTLTGTYSDVTLGGATAQGQSFSEAIKARMAGFSIGIDGSFEL